MQTIQKVRQKFLEILFPAVCLSCKSYLGETYNNQLICEKCFSRIDVFKEQFNILENVSLAAVGSYKCQPLRELIHALKFKRFTGTLVPIRRLIQKFVKHAEYQIPPASLITFIPLHPRRERKRGFNQAKLIADALGEELEAPVFPALSRIRDNKTQISMKNYLQRLDNAKDCFEATGNQNLRGRSIILVDDVYTSGATALEATRVLRGAGAGTVTIFVLAKT